MKIKPVVIGMVAWLLLPLAGANAPAVSDPGLNQTGADLARGAAHPAENFGRKETEDKGDRDGKDHKGKHCDDGDHSDHSDRGDHGEHGGRGGHDDDCDKSPSKPHH